MNEGMLKMWLILLVFNQKGLIIFSNS